MYYTEPRFAKDIDIWVEPTPANAERVWAALAEFGAPLEQIALADFCNKYRTCRVISARKETLFVNRTFLLSRLNPSKSRL